MPAELAHHTRSSSFTKGHKPSLSKSMAWLGRGSAQYAPSKPIQISEPKLMNAFDILHSPRSGALGTGATVVKTPQDALSAQFYEEEEECETNSDNVEVEVYLEKVPSAPRSPDLPPIPLEQNEPELPLLEEQAIPTAPTQSTPLAPVASTFPSFRPSLNIRSSGIQDYSPPVPPFPANITASQVPPPFEPIIVGAPPTSAIDPSKIIVALETSTSTHRTTLKTLTSRSSHLSTYLRSIVSRLDEDTTSVRSHVSDVSTPDGSFNSIFHQHLASSGLLSQSSSNIQIFLDRPSAP